MNVHRFGRLIIAVLLCAPGSHAQTTPSNFRGLPGLIFESEDWSEPRDAWQLNRASPTQWKLWTTEGAGKRSRDAALVSPGIAQDRPGPEDGAPPLHTRIAGLPPGVYRAWLGPTTRPLAYSLDQRKTWQRSTPGETDLGLFEVLDGTFELWVDDRYADPDRPGSTYYDYLRLVPYVPAKLSQLAASTLPDGSTQLSWISSEPAPPSLVECAGHRFAETEADVRNHRVVLAGLPPGAACEAVIRGTGYRSEPVKFRAGEQPRPPESKRHRVPLTITEPTAQPRSHWPVTSGIPFAPGQLASAADVRLLDPAGQPVAAQFQATAHWPDGSIKWLLATFCADTSVQPATWQLVIAPAQAPAAKNPEASVQVRESGDAITLDNGVVTLRISKSSFALFDNLTLGGQPITAQPKGGNGRIVDGTGKPFMLGKPDRIAIEEDGPVRAVIRVAGDFVADDGMKQFRWQARYVLAAGQPWLRLSWTIGNNNLAGVLTNLQSAAVRLPFAVQGPLSGSLEGGGAQPVPNEESIWLLQDKDDRFTARSNGDTQAGEHALGCATVSDGTRQLSVYVRDFWQTYPKGLAIKPDGLHIRVLPPLPPNAYEKEAANDEELVRLYYCYDRGQYRIKRGLEFTTDLFVRADPLSSPGAVPSAATCAAWFQHPLFAVAPPEQYCESGAFGLLEPACSGRFDAYERQVEAGFAKLDQNCRQKHEYGWMNYGDWHGERHFNWGNHEYDLMGALALQFARTGDTKWLWSAERATRHSTDIDTIHEPWQPKMPGRVYAHSIGHVGGFFDMADPRFQRLGNVFGLADPKRPNPFVQGAIDPGGHIFQPGNFRVGFLTGERRYLEIAEMVCAAQAAFLTAQFDFGIERAAGWPLMNAVAAYEATGNPFYLNAARLCVEKILAKQTPRGDWGLKHGPPECLHQPSHDGGKAFATGVLLNALMMFDTVAPSPEVKDCIVRAAHWLERDSWNAETHSFRYIDTCPTFAKPHGNGGTDFLVSSGLAYACTLDPDPKLKSLLLDSLSRAVRGGISAGKDYAQDIRQTPHALAILHRQFGIQDFAQPADAPAGIKPKP